MARAKKQMSEDQVKLARRIRLMKQVMRLAEGMEPADREWLGRELEKGALPPRSRAVLFNTGNSEWPPFEKVGSGGALITRNLFEKD